MAADANFAVLGASGQDDGALTDNGAARTSWPAAADGLKVSCCKAGPAIARNNESSSGSPWPSPPTV